MTNYSKIDKKIDFIIRNTQKYMNGVSDSYIKQEITKAYEFARNAHEGQFRLSGEPYISHPVEAAIFLLNLKPDISSIQACLLHDVIEDTPLGYSDIKEEFGEGVADLCYGLEKLGKVKYTGEDRSVGSLRKMFFAMAEDLRVIFVKLADRLHNMKTLKYHPKPEKRKKIALETLNIYSPIADRLGLYYFKNNLDEECFKILDPQNYRRIKREIRDLRNTKNDFKLSVRHEIKELLKGTGIKAKIDFRIKSIYSIHRKMLHKNLDSLEDLYDLYGVRIIVDDVSTCYKVLGLIHNKWTPIPKKIKDYIALPKPNGYKSLHTTVLGFLKTHRRMPTEFQIKTHDMLKHSEVGVAAHFDYKERGSKVSTDIDWVKELKDLTSSSANSDFLDSLKIDVFKDRIFVLTPAGDTRNLPAGSTPIDFAYDIHTDLGNHVVLAKVNGSVYPLDRALSNGDIVEIVVDKNKTPNPFWLSFVKTVKAKNRIKYFLKKEDKEQNIERGKTLLNKYLENAGLEQLDKDLTVLKNLDSRVYNVEERNALLEQIGDFSLPPNSIIKRIFKSKKIRVKKDIDKDSDSKNTNFSDIEKNDLSIIIGGEEDIPYKFGSCCSKKLGAKIVGHINKKGVITVHSSDCSVLKKVNTNRLLTAYYEGEDSSVIYLDIILILKNKLGSLRDISNILFNMNINVLDISTNRDVVNDRVEIKFGLEILSYDYLLVERLKERLSECLKDNLVSYKVLSIDG